MPRPKIKIPLDDTDRIIEFIGILAILTLVVIPVFYYGDLPDKIPTHFSMDGTPNAYGSKVFLWVLPIVGSALYLGLNVLCRFPHLFNYPWKITEENAERQYRLAIRMLRVMNVCIVWFMAYMNNVSIQTALGNQGGPNTFFILVLLALIFVPVIYYIIKMVKSK